MCTVLLPSGVSPIAVNKYITNITTSGNKIVDRIGGTNNGASDNAVSHVGYVFVRTFTNLKIIHT